MEGAVADVAMVLPEEAVDSETAETGVGFHSVSHLVLDLTIIESLGGFGGRGGRGGYGDRGSFGDRSGFGDRGGDRGVTIFPEWLFGFH